MPRGKKFTAEQIIGKLREAEVELSRVKKVPEMCRKIGVTAQTYFPCDVSRQRTGNANDKAPRFSIPGCNCSVGGEIRGARNSGTKTGERCVRRLDAYLLQLRVL
jgi:hypothetical protein